MPKRKRPVESDGLNPKQRLFAAHYAASGNGGRSVIAAGYSAKGADVQAVRLLGNARVKAAVDAALAVQIDRIELKADAVLNGLKKLAFGAPSDWLTSGTQARCLELLGKHLKLFTEKHEVTGLLTLEGLVAGTVAAPAPPTPDEGGEE
jgi:phage terminase small subunit